MVDKKLETSTSLDSFENLEPDIYSSFKAIFNISGYPIFVKDKDFRLILVNDAFCSLFGLVRDDIIGKTLAENVTEAQSEHFLTVDKKVLSEGKEIICEEELTSNNAPTKVLLTKKNRFVDQKGDYFLVGIIEDITELKQTELREKTRTHVLELITGGEPLPDILGAIVKAVEQENPLMLCSVLLLDDEGKRLLSGTANSLPKFYSDAINGLEIGHGVGSCGTSAYTNQRIIVDDIQTHPFWQDHKGLAEEAGLASCWSQPIRSANGKVLGTFAIYHREINHPTAKDIAIIEQTAGFASIAIEKKQAQENLKRAASVFTHADEGIMITDANAVIIEVNNTFSRMTGYSLPDLLGKNPRILKSDRHPPEFYKEMWDTLVCDGHWRSEIWNRRKDGSVYPVMLTISVVKDASEEVQHYVSLSTDITTMKANQRQLERIAHYDLLTNLPNRALLADRISQAMIQCKRNKKLLAVAFMDLDGFKVINDSYGHSVGDQLLVSVSQKIKEALRDGDTLARIGGDEFIAVMADLEKIEECELILKRVLNAAARSTSISNNALQVTVSIGVTMYPKDNVNAEQLIRHADQAMYIAKQTGKNNYHLFDIEEDNEIHSHHKSIENIRQALQKNEFLLHYQPKINMRTDEVIGVEALIRWQHPKKGLTQPLDFLPAIEGHPISLDLGEWVIEAALKQILAWRKVNVNLPVSVNISAHQLQQQNFTERLALLLAKYPNVKPAYLELEILETSALQDTVKVSTTMNECQNLGVGFALDDFGTGYSSLTYLKRLPAQLIKIDKSFVRDMLEDKDDLAIVSGVVGLAKTFQREVIAEGVETKEHGVALLAIGCELAQGFGIARPMDAHSITDWMNNYKANDSWLNK